MITNKSVEEIVKEHLEEVQDEYNMGGLSDGLYGNYATEVAKRTVNTVLLGVVERVEKLQKDFANDLQENGVVSIKKLYLEEEKRADCQGSYLSLETVLSLLNDQIISNEEKK